MVALNGLQAVLAVVAAEGVDEVAVDDGGGEGALADVHGGEEGPLVGGDVVDLAAVEEHALHAVVATHHVHEVTVYHCGVLLAHLTHAPPSHQLLLSNHILVDDSR